MSFTLISGKSITDVSIPPSAGDCVPYQCGADSGNSAALQWCSMWGQAAALPCVSPSCAPYCTAPAAPAIAAPAPPQVQPNLPMLTPQNITQPLPDISAAVAPEPVSSCSLWCDLNAAIAENPMLAVLTLAAVGVLLWPKGAR